MSKKLLSGLLSLSLLTTMCIPVSATTQTVEYDSSVDTSAQTVTNVAVDAEKSELYTVTLPKTITLDGEQDAPVYDYDVKVWGKIADSHYIRVIPYGDAYLECDGAAIDLIIDQPVRRWTSAEAAATTIKSGEMSVEKLDPGKWVGNAEFLITLDDGSLWSMATCTSPSKLLGDDVNDNGKIDTEDVNDNGVLDDGEDLDADGVLDTEKATEVKTRGRALGHLFAEDEAAFPAVCERCNSACYTIATPAQLTAFKDSVNAGNSYVGTTVTLNNDIDMSGEVWTTPIGVSSQFAGVFDGQNYSISNLTINADIISWHDCNSGRNFGMFAELTTEGTVVKNFRLISPDFTFNAEYTGGRFDEGEAYYGTICGTVADSTISNVHVLNGSSNLNVISDSDYCGPLTVYQGGIVGYSDQDSLVKDCSIIGTTVKTTSQNSAECGVNSGGIVSWADAAVKNCLGAAYMTGIGIDVEAHSIVYEGEAINCVADATRSVANTEEHSGTVLTNCLKATTSDECKTQAAVDILNTDNTAYTWQLDLENINGGYPIIQ